MGSTSFTTAKLTKMQHIRGLKPGATVEKYTVLDKKISGSRGSHWILFEEGSILQPGDHRLNLPPDVWNRYKIGDEIEIVYVPNDSTPYHRAGIFADNGNFMFDRVLQVIEIAVIAVAILGITLNSIRFLIAQQQPSKRTSHR
jgi:hypothetical protein